MGFDCLWIYLPSPHWYRPGCKSSSVVIGRAPANGAVFDKKTNFVFTRKRSLLLLETTATRLKDDDLNTDSPQTYVGESVVTGSLLSNEQAAGHETLQNAHSRPGNRIDLNTKKYTMEREKHGKKSRKRGTFLERTNKTKRML